MKGPDLNQTQRIATTPLRRASARRIVLTVTGIALVTLVPGFRTGATRAATAGLVASYSFDEPSGATVQDVSGNGNNGTIANATRSTAGKYGGALSFNGTNAQVNVPNSSSLQLTTGMTLEAWSTRRRSPTPGGTSSTRGTTTTT